MPGKTLKSDQARVGEGEKLEREAGQARPAEPAE